MKRIAALLTLLLAAATLWACDFQNLPAQATPTPVEALPAATSTLAPAATPTLELAATATATEEPTPLPTSTFTETPAPTEEPTATPTEAAGPPEETPAPKPATRTPAPTSQATAHPDAGVPPPEGWGEIVRARPGNKRIALTFDAGATGVSCPRILDAFRARGIHITMFFTGKFAEQYPDCVKQAAADGHELANHTYSHLDSRTISDEQLKGELDRTDTIVQGLAGMSTKPYWRPPFGARNNHVLNVAVADGYRSVYWTLDSLDSVGDPKTADFIFNRVTNTPGVNLDGAIILQHFGSEASAEALPRILDRLDEMGLQVVTISRLILP